MSELEALASGYAIFLCCVAAFLSRSPARAARADFPHGEIARLRGAVARTLVVLAAVIVAVAAWRGGGAGRSPAWLGAGAIAVGVAAWASRSRASRSRASS